MTFKNILRKYGFKVIKIDNLFHGYILSATVTNGEKSRSIKKFSKIFNINKVIKSLNIFNDKIDQFIKKNNINKFIVWGAGHQSLMIISYFKLRKYIPYLVDSISK